MSIYYYQCWNTFVAFLRSQSFLGLSAVYTNLQRRYTYSDYVLICFYCLIAALCHPRKHIFQGLLVLNCSIPLGTFWIAFDMFQDFIHSAYKQYVLRLLPKPFSCSKFIWNLILSSYLIGLFFVYTFYSLCHLSSFLLVLQIVSRFMVTTKHRSTEIILYPNI